MKLSNLVKVDDRFEQSVNLMLDINNPKKIKGYILTHSSLDILKDYLQDLEKDTGNRSTILIGPYGKGKSHLLLVMLSLITKNKTAEVQDLIQKINGYNKEIGAVVTTAAEGKPYLPIIVNVRKGNIAGSFMSSLNSALHNSGLDAIIPDNFYSEAVKTIHMWKAEYPDTYQAFCSKLSISENDFTNALERFDDDSFKTFTAIYPTLTAGSTFNPVIDDDVITAYHSVNRKLCNDYGYRGMVIIFDEFSKYIEGHGKEGFAADMKTLQDMCELSNSSGSDEQIHLICVAHKSIKSYGATLPKEVLNSFDGVAGRLKEKYFLVSSQNSYELIANAVAKTVSFDSWAKSSEVFQEMSDRSFNISAFNTLFTENDYKNIVARGSFPLTPVASMLLLGLSEKIAQNERTIFTYITSQDINGLAFDIKNAEDCNFIGADRIYDYFVPQFAEEQQHVIHHEWLKADFALTKTENAIEQRVIKTMSIIRMINHPDEIPVTAQYIALALGLSKEYCDDVIKHLTDNGLIEYKKRTASYEFKNNVGVDFDAAIADTAAKYCSKIDIGISLDSILGKQFIIPKKHNQKKAMTRYFDTIYMSPASFMALSNTDYIQHKASPDGTVLYILPDEELDRDKIISHQAELGDEKLVIYLPDSNDSCTAKVQYAMAVNRLKKSSEFTENNPTIRKELDGIEEDAIFEIQAWRTKTYPAKGLVYYLGKSIRLNHYGVNRVVSDICDNIYQKTPRINHELINRHILSAQIGKARNVILKRMLDDDNLEGFLSGTSAESTIYRALFVHTEHDSALKEAEDEIRRFVLSTVSKKQSFESLINTLVSAPFGMRRGVLPFYILKVMIGLDDLPVIYFNNKEMPITPENIVNIVRTPKEYFLYVEKETIQKNQYLDELEKIFTEYSSYCRDVEKKNRMASITCLMQAWYRSLPQNSILFSVPDEEGQDIEKAIKLRKLFSDAYVNPRELLFEKLPAIFNMTDFEGLAEKVIKTKNIIDAHIHLVKRRVAADIRDGFGFSSGSDLYVHVQEWIKAIPEYVSKSALEDSLRLLLDTMNRVKTSDEEAIAGSVAKAVTGTYIEDWNDSTPVEFHTRLRDLLARLAEISEKAEDQSKLTLKNDDGTRSELFYDFDMSNISSTGVFFQNALQSTMEEFDEFLDTNEKVAILLDMVKKLTNQ